MDALAGGRIGGSGSSDRLRDGHARMLWPVAGAHHHPNGLSVTAEGGLAQAWAWPMVRTPAGPPTVQAWAWPMVGTPTGPPTAQAWAWPMVGTLDAAPDGPGMGVAHGGDADAAPDGPGMGVAHGGDAGGASDGPGMGVAHGGTLDGAPDGPGMGVAHGGDADAAPDGPGMGVAHGGHADAASDGPGMGVAHGGDADAGPDLYSGGRAGQPLPAERGRPPARGERWASAPIVSRHDRTPLDRVRSICLALPDATERLSHGEPTWFVRDRRTFAMFADHHHDDRVCVWCAAPTGEQALLLEAHPDLLFHPPYVGVRGWVGIRLDLEVVDWDLVELLLTSAHATVVQALRGRR